VAKTDLLVLVVDDDPIIRQITCEILQAHGIQAQQASSVTEARELALSTPDRWDVLLTDISFRDGNGLELVRELRRQGLNLPVVIMSGIAPLDGNWGTEFGNLVFLPKPFPAKELIETVLSVAPLATPSPSTDRLPPKN
jgi:DNA-binding NtrC family response regulator